MHEWKYVPFITPRPKVEVEYTERNRDTLELVVASQVAAILAYYGRPETYTLLREADMDTFEVINVTGISTQPIPLQNDDTLRLCQVPWLFNREDTTPGLHCIERFYDDENVCTELSVWDPTIAAEYRITDSEGRRPSLDYLKELHAGLIAVEFLYSISSVAPNEFPLYTPAYPIYPLEPEVALMQEQFD